MRTGAEHVIVLETPRLRLRHIVPADLDALVELDADPQVMRYISYGEPTPRARYEQDYLPRFLAYYTSTPLLGYWIAETRADDEFIGWFHLRPDRIDAGEQEIGYRLRRAVWGQGYATELGRALVAHGFERVERPGDFGARTARTTQPRDASWRNAVSATSGTSPGRQRCCPAEPPANEPA